MQRRAAEESLTDHGKDNSNGRAHVGDAIRHKPGILGFLRQIGFMGATGIWLRLWWVGVCTTMQIRPFSLWMRPLLQELPDFCQCFIVHDNAQVIDAFDQTVLPFGVGR